MRIRPTAQQRRGVIVRAADHCEYCLIHQDDAVALHQVDHVIAHKHGGRTVLDNLALSCIVCNRRKSSDISSIDSETGEIVPLFNPRTDSWHKHFRLIDGRIEGVTPVGRTTAEFLELNSFERLAERRELLAAGRWSDRANVQE